MRVSKYVKDQKLIFDGKNINIKMQTGLKKNEEVEFKTDTLGGIILKKSNGYVFGIDKTMYKHFRRIK